MSSPRRRDIFTQYPANTYEDLIVRYSGEDDGRLGASFAQAADRLAGTHTGRPVDDALLLPYLYLYRHAMELDVKHAIRFAAKLRIVKGERDAALSDPALGERLKKTLRHKLPALVTELEKHLVALGLSTMPSSVRSVVNLVAAADPAGESFRYASGGPAGQDNINFVAMSTDIAETYRLLSTAQDMLSAHEDILDDYMEAYRDAQAEMLADMRQEYEQY